MKILMIGNGFDLEHGLVIAFFNQLQRLGLGNLYRDKLLEISFELVNNEETEEVVQFDSSIGKIGIMVKSFLATLILKNLLIK